MPSGKIRFLRRNNGEEGKEGAQDGGQEDREEEVSRRVTVFQKGQAAKAGCPFIIYKNFK